MKKLYRVNDLSKGVEKLPLKALNEYTFEEIENFDYIKTIILDTEIEQIFKNAVIYNKIYKKKLNFFRKILKLKKMI